MHFLHDALARLDPGGVFPGDVRRGRVDAGRLRRLQPRHLFSWPRASSRPETSPPSAPLTGARPRRRRQRPAPVPRRSLGRRRLDAGCQHHRPAVPAGRQVRLGNDGRRQPIPRAARRRRAAVCAGRVHRRRGAGPKPSSCSRSGRSGTPFAIAIVLYLLNSDAVDRLNSDARQRRRAGAGDSRRRPGGELRPRTGCRRPHAAVRVRALFALAPSASPPSASWAKYVTQELGTGSPTA